MSEAYGTGLHSNEIQDLVYNLELMVSAGYASPVTCDEGNRDTTVNVSQISGNTAQIRERKWGSGTLSNMVGVLLPTGEDLTQTLYFIGIDGSQNLLKVSDPTSYSNFLQAGLSTYQTKETFLSRPGSVLVKIAGYAGSYFTILCREDDIDKLTSARNQALEYAKKRADKLKKIREELLRQTNADLQGFWSGNP